MAFEVFRRRSRPVSGQPTIGLQNRGTLSLNAAAFKLLADMVQPTDAKIFVQFLYDPEKRVIGLRPVPPETSDSYPVRKQPASESYLLTGRGFLSYYGLDTTGIRRYRARVFEGGVVGFSLIDDEIDRKEEDGMKGKAST